ncbi:MAG: hypothetical protein ABI726_05205 [bacterium]
MVRGRRDRCAHVCPRRARLLRTRREGDRPNAEGTIPAAFSGALLLIAAAAAFALARREASGTSGVLLALAGVFTWMAIDEVTGIHEHLHDWTGVPWQLLYLPFVPFVAWVAIRTIRALIVPEEMLEMCGSALFGLAMIATIQAHRPPTGSG